jgi:phage terminase small subunit
MGQIKKGALNEKQKRFIAEYMISLNASKAALLAGYQSHKTGSYLLAKEEIKEEIKRLKDELKASQIVTVEYILNALTEVVDRCLKPEPQMIWDNLKRCRVQATNEQGKLVWSFDSSGCNKALELLGRYLGIFDKDNKQRINPLNNKAELTDEQFNKLLDAATKGHEIDY